MNVLFVCHRLPYPPQRGGKIRPFNIIRHLTGQGHRVTVASLARSAEELEAGRELGEFCEEVLVERVGRVAAIMRMGLRLPSVVPSSMGYFHSPQLARRVRALFERRAFDLVFVHCSSAAQYVTGVAAVRSIPKLLDFGDIDSQKWLLYAQHRPFPLSFGYWLEGRKLQQAERLLASQFDLCTCTTRAEMQTLRDFGTGAPTAWFPNGVDAEFFTPALVTYDPDSIVFVGRMDYYPNQDAVIRFCDSVLPAIRARRPTVRFTIVGAEPSARIRRLARQPGVTVTGSVGDVRPYVREAAFSVAPLRIARGTQNKILESMAMGVPVIASPAAAAGVDARPGHDLLVAGTAEEYLDAAMLLLGNEGRPARERYARAARERVLSHHDWASSMRRMDEIIQACSRGAGANRRLDSAGLLQDTN